MSNVDPLTRRQRRKNYRTQTGAKTLTPAQTRRDKHKKNRTLRGNS